MSQTNKDLCRRLTEEAWNNHNLSVIDELVAPDYTRHSYKGPDVGRGPEGFRKMVQYYSAAFPDAHFTIDDMVAEGDRVAFRWTCRGTHKGEFEGIAATNKPVTVTGTITARISNGKIAEAWENWDQLALMEQIGALGSRATRQARGA